MQWQDRMALDHAFSALKKPSKAVMVPSRVLHLKQVIELTAAPRRRDRVAYQGKIFDEEAILGMVEPVENQIRVTYFQLERNTHHPPLGNINFYYIHIHTFLPSVCAEAQAAKV